MWQNNLSPAVTFDPQIGSHPKLFTAGGATVALSQASALHSNAPPEKRLFNHTAAEPTSLIRPVVSFYLQSRGGLS